MIIIAVLLAQTGIARSQEPIVNYHNSVRIEYQFIHTGAYGSSVGPLNLGEADAHIFLLPGNFSLNDRWSVFGSVPYVRKRHKDEYPHNSILGFDQYEPPDLRIIDDGSYQGGLQDFFRGVQYLALDGPFSISPYISYGVPLTNYPFYASAAIGKNIWQAPLGAYFQYIPYFSDWDLQADIAYVFADDYSFDDFVNAFFYNHDRTIKHDYLDAGIGFDFIINNRFTASGAFYRTISSDNVARVDYAFTFGLARNI